MKNILLLLPLFAVSTTLCLAEEAKPNLNDPATLKRFLAEARDIDELQKRGKKGEELYYEPNSQKPYTGWYKIMHHSWLRKIRGEKPRLQHQGQFKDGKLHGIDTGWHKNGKMSYTANHLNGKRHGLRSAWHENGQMRSQSNSRNGNTHGHTTGWHDNEQKHYAANYHNGNKHGLYTTWRKNGQIASQTRWENNKQVEKIK